MKNKGLSTPILLRLEVVVQADVMVVNDYSHCRSLRGSYYPPAMWHKSTSDFFLIAWNVSVIKVFTSLNLSPGETSSHVSINDDIVPTKTGEMFKKLWFLDAHTL